MCAAIGEFLKSSCETVGYYGAAACEKVQSAGAWALDNAIELGGKVQEWFVNRALPALTNFFSWIGNVLRGTADVAVEHPEETGVVACVTGTIAGTIGAIAGLFLGKKNATGPQTQQQGNNIPNTTVVVEKQKTA